MPERICCDPEFLPFRLLRSARIAALRLTDPDRHGAIMAVRAAGQIAALLSRGTNHRILSAGEAAVYTQLQRALKGRTRISSRSLLPLTAEIFLQTKNVISAIHTFRPRHAEAADRITGLMEGAAGLLHCLELQLGAASAQGADFYAKKFRDAELLLRDDLRRARTDILCLPGEDRALHPATILTAFESLLSCVGKAGHAAGKRVRRRPR